MGQIRLDKLDVCIFCGCKAERWTLTTDEPPRGIYEISPLCAACFKECVVEGTYYKCIALNTWRNAGMVITKITRNAALVFLTMAE